MTLFSDNKHDMLIMQYLLCSLIRNFFMIRRITMKNVETAAVFAKSEVKVWECRNCGHLVVGTQAPELCPTCAHPKAYFEVHAENY